MPAWPPYAQVALDRYQASVEPSLHRTPFSDGYIQQKQIYTAARHTLPVSVPLSQADKEAFQIWIKDELKGGSMPFDFRLYDDSKAVSAQIVGGNVRYTLVDARTPKPWQADLTLEWWQ